MGLGLGLGLGDDTVGAHVVAAAHDRDECAYAVARLAHLVRARVRVSVRVRARVRVKG